MTGALILLAACDVSMGDIRIALDSGSIGLLDSGRPEPSAPANAGGSAPPAAGRASEPPVNEDLRFDSGAPMSPVGPPDHPPGVDSGIDSGLDGAPEGGVIDDAQTGAPKAPETGPTVDDGEGGAPAETWPCGSETPGCVPVTFRLYADNVLFIGDGEVEVDLGDVTLDLAIEDGHLPEIFVPVERPIWVRTRIPGYWTDQAMVEIPNGTMRLDGATFVFSDAMLSQYAAPFGVILDAEKAFAMVDFVANLPGAGVDLGVATAPPVVLGPHGLAQSSTLLPSAGFLMLIANVQPGPLEPVPLSPQGYRCDPAVQGLDYDVKPGTVLRMWIWCERTSP